MSWSPDAPALTVDRARPDDFPRIGQLTHDVYVGGGLASPEYGVRLRDVAARADRAELLVVRDQEGRVVGSVALVLSTDRRMTAAQRLYQRLAFTRLPERDWQPAPGIDLLVYALDL